MKAENWITIKQILQEVLNLAPLEREDFWAQSGLSTEIKTEVKSLLEFEDESENFMSATAGNLTGELIFKAENQKKSLFGQKVGIYEIVGELGFGGMGAVYLAERKDGKFSQKVAVKMLRREFNVEKVRRNFKREREILAKLNHPNIAHLLDAGTTVDGVPYLVMEYIEGKPIDEFCEEKKLPLKARLKLFNKVCEAVSFAHRNLIIHRDLKPSNILVTKKGEPKLLDFGISKLLDAENAEDKIGVTMLGAMTPEYASPEQIKGETVTTATDIYSLGVVLYKILTNAHPFDLKGKTNGELLKAITENEPFTPSAMADYKLQITNYKNQRNPQSEIPNPKSLRGDIDNIILKSLRKEPERRYQTVEQFSADIWRFIDGLPILARPATIFYRASKFFGRNKISAMATSLIVLSLITGIAVALWQANVAREQANVALDAQRRSEIETEHAKKEEAKAGKISKFMLKVLSYASPRWNTEGVKFKGETKVIEVMDELGDKIDNEFAGQPDVQSELHHKFAEIYQSNVRSERMEDYKAKALYHARRALELRRQFYGERHELVAKDMAYLYWSGGVEQKNAAKYLMEAINMMRETNPNNLNLPYMLDDYVNRLMMPDAAEVHEQYRNAVIPATVENKYEIAERYLREALPIFRFHYKEDNYAIFGNECRLAYALARQKKWSDFDEHYAVCKQGETALQGGNLSEGMRKNVELVEKILSKPES